MSPEKKAFQGSFVPIIYFYCQYSKISYATQQFIFDMDGVIWSYNHFIPLLLSNSLLSET